MKAEKINELIYRAEGKDINPDSIEQTIDMYRDINEYILDNMFDFDTIHNLDGTYNILCTTYINIPEKEGFSVVINRDCLWGFDTPEYFARYIAELYDRAIEIQNSFNS